MAPGGSAGVSTKHRQLTARPAVDFFASSKHSGNVSAGTQCGAESSSSDAASLTLHILQSHRQMLVLYARALGLRREDAEDFAHDVILKAFHARESFRPGTNLKAWLLTIMRNHHYSQWRRAKFSEPMSDELLATLTVDCTAGSVIDADQMLRRLHALPPRHREVLLLFAAGRTYEQSASHLGIPIGTLKSRLSRARAVLES